MSIESVLATMVVRDLNEAERWYTAVFERGPDNRPMDGLIEWRIDDAAGVQVWVDAERAGRSSMVLGEGDLDGLADRLTAAGIVHPGPQQVTASRILPVEDPDGNQVVFAGP